MLTTSRPMQSIPDLIATLLSRAPEPRPTARTRRCCLTERDVLTCLARAAAYPATPTYAARHGGAVANAYRYPATTSGVAIAAIADEDTVWVAAGSASLAANKVSWAGVVACCVTPDVDRQASLWWARARRNAPGGEVEGVAAWVAQLSDPIAVPRARLLNALQDHILASEHEQAS